jgi:hypothetical protein
VLAIYSILSEFDNLSQSFSTKLYEYLSFYKRGTTFSKNILNVLSFPNFYTFENRVSASGMRLNNVLGSFLFI